MVNTSSMGRFCLVGEPFFDAFNEDFSAQLARIGQTPLWIDNWEAFHVKGGSIHCSTNVQRRPFPAKWWEQ